MHSVWKMHVTNSDGFPDVKLLKKCVHDATTKTNSARKDHKMHFLSFSVLNN